MPLASGHQRVLALRPSASQAARSQVNGLSFSSPLVDGRFEQRHRVQTLFVVVPLANDAVARPMLTGLTECGVDGDPRVVLPGDHAIAAVRASAYARYNQTTPASARLAGKQLDLAPYLLPGYDLAAEAWERHYTTLAAALHTAAGGLPLRW